MGGRLCVISKSRQRQIRSRQWWCVRGTVARWQGPFGGQTASWFQSLQRMIILPSPYVNMTKFDLHVFMFWFQFIQQRLLDFLCSADTARDADHSGWLVRLSHLELAEPSTDRPMVLASSFTPTVQPVLGAVHHQTVRLTLIESKALFHEFSLHVMKLDDFVILLKGKPWDPWVGRSPLRQIHARLILHWWVGGGLWRDPESLSEAKETGGSHDKH